MLAGQAEDLRGIGQRGRHRLVDEQRLAGRNDRSGLRQVRSPVDAHQQYDIDAAEQLVDRIDDLDSHAAHLLRIFLDSIPARRNVGASTGIGRHDLQVLQIAGGLGIVEQLGKGDRVRGVEPDHAGPDGQSRRGGQTGGDC